MRLKVGAVGLFGLVVSIALSAHALPEGIPPTTFTGVGDASVVDYGPAGGFCQAQFVLQVFGSGDGAVAIFRFTPLCPGSEGFPLHWSFHPFVFVLDGNWDDGFSGDGYPVGAPARITIGPYGNGQGIPVDGFVYAGPFAFEWTGAVTELGVV